MVELRAGVPHAHLLGRALVRDVRVDPVAPEAVAVDPADDAAGLHHLRDQRAADVAEVRRDARRACQAQDQGECEQQHRHLSILRFVDRKTKHSKVRRKKDQA